MVSISNCKDSTRSQAFTYDELNRIKTAQSQATSGANCWGDSFAYDIWANLLSKTVTKCTAETLSVTISTKNQITNTGFTYDAAGNLTNSGSGVMTYDAENRLVTAAGVTYVYDGDGKRIKKSNGKVYWTGMGSDTLSESDLAGTLTEEFVFLNGKRVARRIVSSGAIYYYFGDHLGTSRIITSSTGSPCYDADYYPYGGERVYLNTCPQNYKFTGKERDTESGLDYFIARHYSANLGRFLQADEFAGGPVDAFSSNDPLPKSPLPYANIASPQSLNKYTYTYNDPLRYIDPNGHEILGTGPHGEVQLDPETSAAAMTLAGAGAAGIALWEGGAVAVATARTWGPAVLTGIKSLCNSPGAQKAAQDIVEGLTPGPNVNIKAAAEAFGFKSGSGWLVR